MPVQMHLDFYVDDLTATEARVLAAGATKYGVQPAVRPVPYRAELPSGW